MSYSTGKMSSLMVLIVLFGFLAMSDYAMGMDPFDNEEAGPSGLGRRIPPRRPSIEDWKVLENVIENSSDDEEADPEQTAEPSDEYIKYTQGLQTTLNFAFNYVKPEVFLKLREVSPIWKDVIDAKLEEEMNPTLEDNEKYGCTTVERMDRLIRDDWSEFAKIRNLGGNANYFAMHISNYKFHIGGPEVQSYNFDANPNVDPRYKLSDGLEKYYRHFTIVQIIFKMEDEVTPENLENLDVEIKKPSSKNQGYYKVKINSVKTTDKFGGDLYYMRIFFKTVLPVKDIKIDCHQHTVNINMHDEDAKIMQVFISKRVDAHDNQGRIGGQAEFSERLKIYNFDELEPRYPIMVEAY